MIDVNTWVMIDNGYVWQMSTSCTADQRGTSWCCAGLKGIARSKRPYCSTNVLCSWSSRDSVDCVANGPCCCLLNSTDVRALADTKLARGLAEVRQTLAISHRALPTCRTLCDSWRFPEQCQRLVKAWTALSAFDFNRLDTAQAA